MAYFPFLLLGPFVISLFVKYIQHLLSLPIHPLITLEISTKELTPMQAPFYGSLHIFKSAVFKRSGNTAYYQQYFKYSNVSLSQQSFSQIFLDISFLIPLNHVCTARVEMLILSIVGFQYLICLDHYSYISQI